MKYKKYTVRTTDRDRLIRSIRNAVVYNASIVNRGLFNSTEEDKTRRIAELVAEDVLKDFRLVRRP